MVAAASVLAAVSTADAQTWPSKPIRLVTVEAGGASDLSSRTISNAISPALGQRLVVENRPSSTRPEQQILKSAPDGHTVLLWANQLWLLPFLTEVNYDPVKDFAPISLVAQIPYVLVVHPSLPVKSAKDLIALAKARPGQLNVGTSSSPASSTGLAAMMLMSMSGVEMTRINYKGIGQSMTDLVAGNIQVLFPSVASSLPFVKAGKARALAVTTAQPSAQLPELPPLKTLYPDFESASIQGMFVAANTPAPIIKRLHEEVAKALKDPGVRETMLRVGVEPIGGTPDQMTAKMQHEMRTTGKLVKALAAANKSGS